MHIRKLKKNPWKQSDVKHKNKKAYKNLYARKLWVRVANKTLRKTNNDRLAIIAANIAVRNYFEKYSK